MLELAASLVISTTAPKQIPPGWEIPCVIGFGLGVLFSQNKPKPGAVGANNNSELGENPISPKEALPLINTDYEHYLEVGKQIIAGFAVSDRSQMIVAPSRCGKTTVMYFLLDEFFKRHPKMWCWVWQGKTIEPVHPNIPRCRHVLFQMEEPDLTAINEVYKIYRDRAEGDADRTLTKLVITDWQSIKDGLCATNTSLFKEVAAKIITLANNGAALCVTVTGDTQSANIDDWGLGSGSLRDNFDIYAVSRIEWVDNYAKGDIKALPKLIQNDDIVVSHLDRKTLLNTFELLKQWMEEQLITSSVLLSTVGSCSLGTTPYFDRCKLQWEREAIEIESENSEANNHAGLSIDAKQDEIDAKQIAATPSSDTDCFASQPLYTPLKLSKSTARKILQQVKAETRYGQDRLIRVLWGAKAGDNDKYQEALLEYQELTEIAEESYE